MFVRRATLLEWLPITSSVINIICSSTDNGLEVTEGQPVLLFLHELGHALGLEHPFDDSDGDCLFSDEPWSRESADASVTVMAYKSSERPVGFFTDLHPCHIAIYSW